MPNRREFLRIFGGVAAAMLTSSCLRGQRPVSRPVRRPNILFILSDDHARRAIGAYGSSINTTPNIDRIAQEGMRFDSCFCVNSLCVPSRGSIMTGQFSHRSGVRLYWDRLDVNKPTFATLLQQSGYQTAIVGKWHLSVEDVKNYPAGFDYWNIWPGLGKYFDPVMFEMGEKKTLQGYVTDVVTDLSIDWLEKRDPDKPFLLCCNHKAPHDQWEYDQAHAELYADEIPEPETFDDDHSGHVEAVRLRARTIQSMARDMKRRWPTGELTAEEIEGSSEREAAYQKMMRDYLRTVASLDDNVGRILKYLDESGLAEDTVVIYASDQGAFLGEHGWYDKRMIYEESIRMPLMVRYPGEVKAGSTCDKMVLNVDFAETILDLAGVPVPKDMQGRSLLPLLQGDAPRDWRTSFFYIFYHHGMDPKHYGVRTERHKLIRYPDTDAWELFDLQEDPLEMKSLHADEQYQPVLEELKKEMHRLIAQLEVPQEDLRPGNKDPLSMVAPWRLKGGTRAESRPVADVSD